MKFRYCSIGAGVTACWHSKALRFILVGLLAACTASDEDRVNPLAAETSLEPSERVEADGMLLVFVREYSFDSNVDNISEEESFVACIREGVFEARPGQAIVSFDDFHRTVFPNFKRRSVPRNPEFFSALLDSREFRQGMTRLGVRYVAFVGGLVKVEQSGGGGCIAGFAGTAGAVACMGYWEWGKASHLGASVLDLRRAGIAESFESTETGTAWLALVANFPVGVPSKPSDVACRLLGKDIARHLNRVEGA